VGRLLLNVFLYPSIKTSLQKNSIVSIFILRYNDNGSENSNVVAWNFLTWTKSQEDRDKLAASIKEFGIAEDGTIIKHWHPYFIPDELRHKLEEAGRQLAADASASKSHEFNNSGSNVPNLFLMKLGDGCGRMHRIRMCAPVEQGSGRLVVLEDGDLG
ncbi:hypothetical protein Tco_0742978, partial [Tanacetum coccineum]